MSLKRTRPSVDFVITVLASASHSPLFLRKKAGLRRRKCELSQRSRWPTRAASCEIKWPSHVISCRLIRLRSAVRNDGPVTTHDEVPVPLLCPTFFRTMATEERHRYFATTSSIQGGCTFARFSHMNRVCCPYDGRTSAIRSSSERRFLGSASMIPLRTDLNPSACSEIS